VYSGLIITSFAEYKDQHLALGVIPGALGSETQALASLKADLDAEEVARVTAQVKADVLSRAVHDLKVSVDRFATQIPTLEDKVKHLEDKVVEGLKEVRACELCLECTTQANDNYQKEVAQLTKKLESKSPD
jgi:chromosome segregation ATPase